MDSSNHSRNRPFGSRRSNYRRKPKQADQFIQTNFQYVVNKNFKADTQNPDQRVIWNLVETAIFSPEEEEYCCPVCFDDEICAPKMTPCGHIFCYPCIVHLFKGYDVCSSGYMKCNEENIKCPLCNEIVSFGSLRSVEINEFFQPKEGDELEFVLLKREKRSNISTFAFDQDNIDDIPYHRQKNAKFCRFQKVDPSDPFNKFFGTEAELLRRDEVQLMEGLKYVGEGERLYHELALEHTNCLLSIAYGYMDDVAWETKQPNFSVSKYLDDDEVLIPTNNEEDLNLSSSVPDSWEDIDISKEIETDNNEKCEIKNQENENDEESNCNEINEEIIVDDVPKQTKNFRYFYQHVSGRKIFVNKTSIQKLRRKYGSWSKLPVDLKCKVNKIETVTVDAKLRSTIPSLSHVPLNSTCWLCTID